MSVDVKRCKRCNWPIVPEGEAGCWESNCSMRPLPPLPEESAKPQAPAQPVSERLLKALKDTLAGKPVRDMDEVVLEAENSIAADEALQDGEKGGNNALSI